MSLFNVSDYCGHSAVPRETAIRHTEQG